MTKEWATSGVDLHLDLDRRHVRASLEAALRDAMLAGRLVAGTVLPSSRSLAADLDVARNTVVEVYGQLVAEGWLHARSGSKTTVADRVPVPRARTSGVADAYPVVTAYDLRPGWPDLESFPRRAWLLAARRAIAAAPPEAFGYNEPRGRPEVRRALADYLARVRGVHVDPGRVVTCMGTMHGLHLLARALRFRGARTWATDRYGLWIPREDASEIGLVVRLLDSDNEGIDVDDLEGVDVAVLSPGHSFPLGVTMSTARRRDVVRWAERSSGWIIEDDYDGEFRYDRRTRGALQALGPDRVIYAGTASKALAPGLRLGWLVVPDELLDEVLTVKTLAVGHNSTIDQLILAEFMGSGEYDRHVRRSRVRYRRRRNELVTALQRFPSLGITGVAAGLHLVVTLPSGVTESDVIEAARHRGLFIEGLATYTADYETVAAPAALVIGYGTPPDHRYSECVERLCSTFTYCRV